MKDLYVPSEEDQRDTSISFSRRQRVGAVAAGIGLFAAGIIGGVTVATASAERPAYVSECGDGKVALKGGDFSQAAREAGIEAGAGSGVDYLAIGSALSEAAKTPENPDGLAYAGYSVRVFADPEGEIIAFGHGTCPEPVELPGS